LELPTPLPTSDEVSEIPDEPEEELALVDHNSTPPSVRAERGSFASDDSETPDEPEEEFPPAVHGSTPPSVRAERGSFAADNERLRTELQLLSEASSQFNHHMQQNTWMAQATNELWSEEKTNLARRRAQECLLRDLHDSECRDLYL